MKNTTEHMTALWASSALLGGSLLAAVVTNTHPIKVPSGPPHADPTVPMRWMAAHIKTNVVVFPPMPDGSVMKPVTNIIRVSAIPMLVPATNPYSGDIVLSFPSPPHEDFGILPINGTVKLHMILTGNWVLSSTNINGPWTNHVFIPAQGTNVTVIIPVDKTKPRKYFKISSPIFASLTNP